jgi:hypothetical protein
LRSLIIAADIAPSSEAAAITANKNSLSGMNRPPEQLHQGSQNQVRFRPSTFWLPVEAPKQLKPFEMAIRTINLYILSGYYQPV